MRDYQIEGLNWLIQLYDKGMSGILGMSCFFIVHKPSVDAAGSHTVFSLVA